MAASMTRADVGQDHEIGNTAYKRSSLIQKDIFFCNCLTTIQKNFRQVNVVIVIFDIKRS